MTKRKSKATYANKIKKASHILFYRRHQKPGVKGWELHKALGSDYPKIIEILEEYLKPLDLQVKIIFDDEKENQTQSVEELDKARFFVTLKGHLDTKDLKMIGWRIDDIAGLAITISYIISKKGQAERKEVEQILNEKIPGWKVNLNLDRYIRYGYLQQDDKGQLYIDWRTRAEIDQKVLIDSILQKDKDENE